MLEVIEQAYALEAQGGLMLLNGSRRRTRGGVFFQLVREQTATLQLVWQQHCGPRSPSCGRGASWSGLLVGC
jgi:hypothetical protein